MTGARQRIVRAARSAWLCAAALGVAACATGSATPPPPDPSVRIRLEMLGGFPAQRTQLPETRVALLLDSTASMARRTAAGPSRVRSARAAAERFAVALPLETSLSLFVLGDDRGAGCDDLRGPVEGERDELLREMQDLRARGEGSLARALGALPGPQAGGFERVVAVSALDDGCGGDLCQAAADLATRGVRLDLVHIGTTPAPACLADVTRVEADAPPVPWVDASPVGFHVQSVGPDPAILVCGESGGLPVQLDPGRADVVVKLDPPLRVQRNFLPGTRWVLQVLDFPGLDPPERQWRWQADPAPTAPPSPAGSGDATRAAPEAPDDARPVASLAEGGAPR